MNAPNFISKLLKNQSPTSEVEKLMQRLPGNLDETAKSNGAIVRRRKINSGEGLFLAIAIYVVMELSQRVLAATFSDIINVTDQAWQKKLYVANHGYPIFCLKLCPNSPIMPSHHTRGGRSS